ncbi:MAG: hypothetical protein ABIR68_15945 [Ilumatobacteraceae bacterium]
MSFQPTTSTSGVVAPPVGASNGKRSPVLVAIGVALLVAGVVVGLVLVSKASSSVGDNAEKLARAPGGCTTSLEFDKTGEFIVFYESRGKVADLGGDCAGNGASFDRGDDEPPQQSLTLVDPNDKDVVFDDASGTSYDAGGFKGAEISKVTIDEAGLYKLTVAPNNVDDADYAIAIGRDPTADEGTLKATGLGALIAGVVLGAGLIVLGLRRRRGGQAVTVTAIPANNWNPTSPAPSWQPQPQPQSPTLSPTHSPAHPSWPPQAPPQRQPTWPPQQAPSAPPGFGSPPTYAPPPAAPSPPERPAPLERTSPFEPPRPPDS